MSRQMIVMMPARGRRVRGTDTQERWIRLRPCVRLMIRQLSAKAGHLEQADAALKRRVHLRDQNELSIPWLPNTLIHAHVMTLEVCLSVGGGGEKEPLHVLLRLLAFGRLADIGCENVFKRHAHTTHD